MELEKLRKLHPQHWEKANAIRVLTLDAVAAANSGHSGMPIGMADVATILFEKHLKFSTTQPNWPDRDRFILSAGHGSMLLYSIAYLCGYADFDIDQLKNFRQLGKKTAGHPENFLSDVIETTTGPLGQGIANSVGFAIAEESLRARFGRKIIDHHTFVIAGDGCLMEGVSQEAISLAGHLRLHKLIVFWDNNNITIDGTVDLTDSTDQKTRFEASGWEVIEIDGHDPEEIDSAISAAKKSEKPTMIACKTHIAIGTAAQDTSKGHGALTDPELIKNAREVYQWSHKPFDIPKSIKEQWEQAGLEGHKAFKRWQSKLENLSNSKRKEFERIFSGDAPKKLTSAIRKFKKESSAASPTIATRKSSELTLNAINSFMQETIGGSADLTGSNNTKSNDMKIFDKNNRKGRYIHYGIREHAMAAAMNGMALHGGIRPYGGTFMCFTDYARPAMRLAALMKIPTIFVMTHDSIGLGEDGPTHQPVEHLAISRSTPNTLVFRPADTIETAECWEIALSMKNTPSVLALSRQNLPTVRQKHQFANLVSKGAYILEEASKNRRVILIATGSEVSIALKARELLEDKGIGTRVVSMPCMELFSQQDETYKRRILPAGQAIRIGIEAGVRTGWDEWLLGHRARANKSSFVGMKSFGASAPAEVLFNHFGITPDRIASEATNLL